MESSIGSCRLTSLERKHPYHSFRMPPTLKPARYMLMMHQHIHMRGVLAKRNPWRIIDFVFPFITDPLFGHTWNTYFYHHGKGTEPSSPEPLLANHPATSPPPPHRGQRPGRPVLHDPLPARRRARPAALHRPLRLPHLVRPAALLHQQGPLQDGPARRRLRVRHLRHVVPVVPDRRPRHLLRVSPAVHGAALRPDGRQLGPARVRRRGGSEFRLQVQHHADRCGCEFFFFFSTALLLPPLSLHGDVCD